MQLSAIHVGSQAGAMDLFNDMMGRWAGSYWNLLAFIVALGAVATALLQLLNDLSPVRAVSHTILLRRWIEERSRMYRTAGAVSSSASKSQPASKSRSAPKAPRPIDTNDALAQLIAHATGGHWRALLGLPPAQLVAQINAAAQGALENPEANYSLIAVLSQPVDSRILLVLQRGQVATRVPSHIDDLSILLKPPPQPPVAAAEADQAKRDKAMKNYEDKLKKYVEARTHVVHRIQRNLDGMQITLGNASTLITQILAILISVAICYGIEFKDLVPEHTYLATVLLIGISAGYVAPILGDVVAAIHRMGRAS
jgi:hypothetical protein